VDVTVRGFGLSEVTSVSFGGVRSTIQARSPDGTWIKVTSPSSPGGDHPQWVGVVATTMTQDGRSLQSATHPGTLFAYYRAGVPIMRPGPDIECSPARLIAVIWDAQGRPITDDSLASNIRFRTDRGSFSATSSQTEFTPLRLKGNQAEAQIFDTTPTVSIGGVKFLGPSQAVPSVRLLGRDEDSSSRLITFTRGEDCVIKLDSGSAQVKLFGTGSGFSGLNDDRPISLTILRDLLGWIMPPIPNPTGPFSDVVRPFQLTFETAPAGGWWPFRRFRQEIRVQVTDAEGRPVAGLPIAFLASAGTLKSHAPILTDKDGKARIRMRLGPDGGARVLALVGEDLQPLTLQITGKRSGVPFPPP
jgi:hypothetical protein